MAAAKRRRKKSYTGKAVAVFMVAFTAVVGVSVYGQAKELGELKKTEASILESIEQEKEKTVELKAEQDYYSSDAYIESIAREQLGLIMPDERVFINKAEN